MHLYLYGAPGSGKSTVGRILANRLERPFIDLDHEIEAGVGRRIPKIFEQEGEEAFRALETRALEAVSTRPDAVVALGGGALLAPENRACAERTGRILFLDADAETLSVRTRAAPGKRPLLDGDRGENPLRDLLERRAGHYASFPLRVESSNQRGAGAVADFIQAEIGLYRVRGMGKPYDVHVSAGGVDRFSSLFKACGGGGRSVVVADSHTAGSYGARVVDSLRRNGVEASLFTLPAGEEHKTLESVAKIWSAFLHAGIERGDTVVAVGGGVVGDLTGFAASSWLRGVRWICVPTTLLSMVDSSLGGKTGADLPEGKNLIGAFHPPAAVLADPSVLATLPVRDLRCGLAEAIKHGILSPTPDGEAVRAGIRNFLPIAEMDPDTCWPDLAGASWLARFVAHALAVKVRVITEDPFERGIRASLNLGHTIGHGIEKATRFAVHHGEAVAIGSVAAGRLALWMQPGGERVAQDWPDELVRAFSSVGLPTALPGGLDWEATKAAILHDKKRRNGVVRFVLPCGWGRIVFSPVPGEVLDRLVSGPLS